MNPLRLVWDLQKFNSLLALVVPSDYTILFRSRSDKSYSIFKAFHLLCSQLHFLSLPFVIIVV